MSESPDAEAELDRLLQECLDRPEDQWISALEERCAAYPDRAATLRRRFGMLARLGMADGSLDAAQAETVSGPATEAKGLELPGYEIGEVMGGGSMGIVYGGVREASRDPVAIKVLHGHLLGSEGARRRFQREADLAGRVEHPNLCGVLEAGIRAGIPYLVMRRIRGISLKEWIPRQDRTDGDPDRGLAVLRWGEQVARALHAIHLSGLVHRDVKPGNIVVEGEGPQARAVLVDFGLAREEGTDRFTATGEIVGSPAYLSPEALSAAPGEPSQDIYALGATLFEALTGRLPFVAPTREGLFRAVLTGEVPSVGAVPGVRERDCDLVLATAMARDAGQRYQSAAAMAEDLAALADQRAVSVRAPGPAARAAQWFGRHPVVAWSCVALALGLGLSLWALAASATALGRVEAVALRWAAASENGSARIRLARAALARDPTPQAVGVLQLAVGSFRQGTRASIAGIAAGPPDAIRFAAGGWCARVGNVEIDARGGRAPAVTGRDPTIGRSAGLEARIEVGTGALLLAREGAASVRIPDRGWGRSAVAVSPAGGLVATAEGDGAVRLWTAEGALVDVLVGHPAAATCVAFDAGGRRLASASVDGEIRTWEVETHGQWWGGETVVAMAPCRTGVALALASGDVVGCDPAGAILWRCSVPGVTALAGDGHRLVAGDRVGGVWVLDGEGAAPRPWRAADGGVGGAPGGPVAVAGEGLAAVVGAEQRSLWLARTPDGAVSWKAPEPVTALAVDDDGALAGLADGTVLRVAWDGTPSGPRRAQAGAVTAIALAGDGRWLTGGQGAVRLWSAGSQEPVATWPHEGSVTAVAWLDGDRVSTATSRGVLQVRRASETGGAAEWVLERHPAGVRGLLPIGRLLLCHTGAGGVRGWDADASLLRKTADQLVPPDRDGEVVRQVLDEK